MPAHFLIGWLHLYWRNRDDSFGAFPPGHPYALLLSLGFFNKSLYERQRIVRGNTGDSELNLRVRFLDCILNWEKACRPTISKKGRDTISLWNSNKRLLSGKSGMTLSGESGLGRSCRNTLEPLMTFPCEVRFVTYGYLNSFLPPKPKYDESSTYAMKVSMVSGRSISNGRADRAEDGFSFLWKTALPFLMLTKAKVRALAMGKMY
jgi:hypothetical protein